MKDLIRKLKKISNLPWLFAQPLTKIPKKLGDPISELFVWRNSFDCVTFFELIDLASFFEEKTKHREVLLIFFNADGSEFHREKIKISCNTRNIINLSGYVSKSKDSIGTFCVFHETPNIVKQLGSYITDRGYISYQYKNAPIRSYVHGNLDAVAYSNNQKLIMLGGKSFFKREYQLQYNLSKYNYDLVLLNPTDCKQDVLISFFKTNNSDLISTQSGRLRPREVSVFSVKGISGQRAVITSNLVMARPIVFKYNKKHMSVFHG
jgi:hypothetical protein